jgi:flotillin-like protein/integrase-like protein
MTPDAGSPLRQRMIEDMVARKLALGTQRGHIFACKQLAAYLGRSPEAATPDDVRSFQRHLIDNDNRLSAEIVQMKLRLALIEQLRDIIRESVKPLENIDSIKILQVDGLATGPAHENGAGNPSDQIVQSALKYRAQAPLIDSLLKELGFDGVAPVALASALDRHVGAGKGPFKAASASSSENGESG